MICGELAEWLRSGLQIRVHRFDSGTRLQVYRFPIATLLSFGNKAQFIHPERKARNSKIRDLSK